VGSSRKTIETRRKLMDMYLSCGNMAEVSRQMGFSRQNGHEMMRLVLETVLGSEWRQIKRNHGLRGLRKALEESGFWK